MRSLFLSANPTLEQLLEVQEHFGLPGPALVEKDWYVVKALAALAAVDTGDFRLVFGGGTALSRAYKLTKRMSERCRPQDRPRQGSDAWRAPELAQKNYRCAAGRGLCLRS